MIEAGGGGGGGWTALVKVSAKGSKVPEADPHPHRQILSTTNLYSRDTSVNKGRDVFTVICTRLKGWLKGSYSVKKPVRLTSDGKQ